MNFFSQRCVLILARTGFRRALGGRLRLHNVGLHPVNSHVAVRPGTTPHALLSTLARTPALASRRQGITRFAIGSRSGITRNGLDTSTRAMVTATGLRATGASLDEPTGLVKVEFEGTGSGAAQEYPFVWLRDNCQCASCFHPMSKARLMPMLNLDLDVVARSVQINSDRNQLAITWSDGHVSPYAVTWLWERRFAEDNMAERDRFRQHPHQLWGAELQDNIPVGDFNAILNDDEALLHWISTLEETGLFLLQGAPLEPSQLHRLAARVSFLRRTCFGETFHVINKVEYSNLAYTPSTLEMHTDQPTYKSAPGMLMLHCIVPTPAEGGENCFSDGFRVAEQIRIRDPDSFRILTTTPVDFTYTGADYYEYIISTEKPVFSLDEHGEVTEINYNNQARESQLTVPLHAVKPLYAALRMFVDIHSDDNNVIRIKLQAGEIVCFNNLRVLHGRSAYQPVTGVERHMEVGYIDWDELRSRRRVLEVKHDLRR